jgi:phenylpropionate dioxygenase-like ring-hydroxylating dioxygenase large terminal subunit
VRPPRLEEPPRLPALRHGNWLLICDNLLDFSHLSYVHEHSLGGSTAIAQARAEIEDGAARHPRHAARADVPAPPFYTRFRSFDTNIDRWFVYDFLLPATLLMHSGGRPTGRPTATTAMRSGCTAARR